MSELRAVATHPLVLLHFRRDTERWSFGRYFVARQSQCPALLSLLDVIEDFRCWRPVREVSTV